jgi:hypothetical protein
MTLLLSILLSLAAEVIDLGVLSPNRGFVLGRNTDRPDFAHYQAELISFPSSNRLSLRLTNELLTLSEVAALPSGRTVLDLVAVYQDGQQSASTLYRFDIRRGVPPAPSARPTVLSAVVSEAKPFQRPRPVHGSPPVPFGTNQVASPPPAMPGGRSKTYGEHLDQVAEGQMADFYARNPRKRLP